ncbi:MAG: amidophosphoribosyltransferase [Dehalococcoidia bacterium]
MVDQPKEACGLFGIHAPEEDVARLTFFGLFALQHRGQESAGIATADGRRLYIHTSMGLVSQAFDESALEGLTGHMAIGHARYSTTGSSSINNAQPIRLKGPFGEIAVGHNGNLVNAIQLRDELAAQGVQFKGSTDTEVIAQWLTHAPGKTWPERIKYCINRFQGAYCLVVLTPDSLIGIRDPLGVRPLALGRLNGGWVLASESCALDHIGSEMVREVEPGEAIIIDGSGLQSFQLQSLEKKALCIFEHIYFARPDSIFGGRLIHLARQRMGAQLAREYPVEADMVMGVPDSAVAAAIGYSRESGIPLGEGILKNRYAGRTFIEPDQRIRELGVRLKFNTMPEVLKNKKVVVVDDSIVRGTTTPHVVGLLRKAGVTEVHMRICAPPIRYPCFFGVDFATRMELLAAQKSVSEICEYIGANSLGYLSVEGLIEAVGIAENQVCTACFTGRYPIPVQLEMDKLALEVS